MAEYASRQVRGEIFGKVLADFLNRLDERERRLQKKGIRLKKHRMTALFEDIFTLTQVSAMPRNPEREKDAHKLQRRLNRQLRVYSQYPQIRLAEISTAGMLRPFIVFETPGNAPYAEHIIVDALGGLLRESLLDRERRCMRCNRWYFAKKEDSRYCTRSCQTTTTEETKKRKRAYMKTYYQLKKSGKVN
jgi:hypothetical protein